MARFALIVTWMLFAGWVGWLAWQSIQHDRFPIVSRAQLLEADVGVIAEVYTADKGQPSPKVKVVSTIWPAKPPVDLKDNSKVQIRAPITTQTAAP